MISGTALGMSNTSSAPPSPRPTREPSRFVHALQLLERWFREVHFDLVHRTFTVLPPHLSRLGVRPRDCAESEYYHPTPAAPLREALRVVFERYPHLTRDQGFLEVGCGAGKGLLVAREFPFSKLVGLEQAPLLVALARFNLRPRTENKQAPPCEVRCVNALTHPLPEECTCLYLNHPFRPKGYREFCTNLARSLRSRPRTLLLLLYNISTADPQRLYEEPLRAQLACEPLQVVKAGGRTFSLIVTRRPLFPADGPG